MVPETVGGYFKTWAFNSHNNVRFELLTFSQQMHTLSGKSYVRPHGRPFTKRTKMADISSTFLNKEISKNTSSARADSARSLQTATYRIPQAGADPGGGGGGGGLRVLKAPP